MKASAETAIATTGGPATAIAATMCAATAIAATVCAATAFATTYGPATNAAALAAQVVLEALRHAAPGKCIQLCQIKAEITT